MQYFTADNNLPRFQTNEHDTYFSQSQHFTHIGLGQAQPDGMKLSATKSGQERNPRSGNPNTRINS